VIIVDEVLAIPLCLALYLSLRRVHESLMLIATALSAASIICFLVATPALNMLYLSQQYASATTAVDREGLRAAGQAVLSDWLGTPYQVGYVLGSIDMLLVGLVMLRSQIFSKATAYVGIAASVVGFGSLRAQGRRLHLDILGRGDQIWYVLIARTLLRLSSGVPVGGIATDIAR
jgi:hypothetical protein